MSSANPFAATPSDPLTPNTKALLAYFSSISDVAQTQMNGNNSTNNLFTAPPSAFFNTNIPTNFGNNNGSALETTPESSSNAASASPDAVPPRSGNIGSEDSDGDVNQDGRRRSSGGAGNHKRKAGHGHTIEDISDDEEDDESDIPSGHDDKRASKTGSLRRGRKSTEDGKPGKEISKAARRKEQNRAAQKAFRERREAKVKDLEDKVAELEQKSFSATAENENLRGILKKLQEENVALKQSAFTFSMPVNKTSSPSSSSNPIVNGNLATYRPQSSKPPSPPHSVDDGALRSINDPAPSASASKAHRASTSSEQTPNKDSPESLVSINEGIKGHHPMLENLNAFNAFAAGGVWMNPYTSLAQGQNANQNQSQQSATANNNGQQPATSQSFAELLASLSRSNSSSLSPKSNASNNKSEIDALWASFYAPNANSAANQPQNNQAASGTNKPQASNSNSNPAISAPSFAQQSAFGNTSSNGLKNIDKMAFRDSSSNKQESVSLPKVASPAAIDWSKFAENSDMDFLNSILGTSNNNNGGSGDNGFSADDEFQASLNALLQQSGNPSPSDAFALPTNNNPGFSPTTYLNMSPSPLASISNSQSPSSILNSASQSGTPESSGSSMPSSNMSTLDVLHQAAGIGPAAANSQPVQIVDETGRVLSASEVWVKMGMQHVQQVDDLVIEDLCDNMRAKATCQDVKLTLSDAEQLFKYRGTASHTEMKTQKLKDKSLLASGLNI